MKFFQMKASGTTAEINILEQIGKSFFDDSGVSAKSFIDELKALGNVKTITLNINSPGGSVFDGQAIYTALMHHPATVYVNVLGMAASIASVIAMAGDTVSMPANAMIMIHDPAQLLVGSYTADEMRKNADVLDKIKQSAAAAYTLKTGKSQDEINQLMTAETYMNAEEAKEWGFIDSISETTQLAASMNPADVKLRMLEQSHTLQMQHKDVEIQTLTARLSELTIEPASAERIITLCSDFKSPEMSGFFRDNKYTETNIKKHFDMSNRLSVILKAAEIENAPDVSSLLADPVKLVSQVLVAHKASLEDEIDSSVNNYQTQGFPQQDIYKKRKEKSNGHA